MAAISPPKAVKAVDWNSCLHWGKRNNLSPADIDYYSSHSSLLTRSEKLPEKDFNYYYHKNTNLET